MININIERLVQWSPHGTVTVPGSEKVTITFDTEEDRKRYAELMDKGIEMLKGEDDG